MFTSQKRPQKCNISRACAVSASVLSRRYAAPLYVDIKKSIITRQPDGEEEEIDEMYPKTFLGEVRPLAAPRHPCSWVNVASSLIQRIPDTGSMIQ